APPRAGPRAGRGAWGPRAVLDPPPQGGLGVYPFGVNGCANDAVTTYLTTGQRPARDLACAAEPAE
ncbi:alpha/beta hydrolase, partial [Streptomyces albidoflavus]